MSRKDDNQLSEHYRRAPRAASPDHLDQRILRTARAQTPAWSATGGRRWAPVMATACVAGLALYVATPLLDQEPLVPSPARQDTNRDAPATLQSAPVPLSDSAEPLPEASQRPAASPRRKLERYGTVANGDRPAGPDGDAFTTRKVENDEEQVAESDFAQSAVVESSGGNAPALSARNQQQDRASNNSSEPAGSLEQADTPGETRRTAAETSSYPEQRLSPEEISRRLEEIQTLAGNALEARAQRLLDDLIRRCGDCDLPATVAELRRDAVPAEAEDTGRKP